MLERHDPHRLERRGLDFLLALRDGDAGRLADLWQAAEDDPPLGALFAELLADADGSASPADLPAGSPTAGWRPLSLPYLSVHHNIHDDEGQPDARAVKKAR